jgi:O-antigen/teichoic acid export membrane protein
MFKSVRHHEGLIYITIGNFVGATLTGIFWLLLAMLQDVHEYGQINYVIAIGSLSSSVSLLGLNTAVTTLVPQGHKKIDVQANQVILISATVCAIIASLFNLLLGLFVIGMAFWMMSSYELLSKKLYSKYAINIIGARGSQLVLSIILYSFFGLQGIIIGFIISFFAFSITYFKTIPQFSKSFDKIKKEFKTSLHLYSYNLSNALLLYFDKLIIAPIYGYTILGYYQLGFQFLMFFSMISVSFYQYLISEESSGSKRNRLRVYGIALSIIITILVFVLAPVILQVFFPNYINTLNSIRILSLGIIPMMITSMLNSKFLAMKLTRYVLFSSITYQVTQIILIVILGKQYGIDGISMSVVIAMLFQITFLGVTHLRLSKKNEKNN